MCPSPLIGDEYAAENADQRHQQKYCNDDAQDMQAAGHQDWSGGVHPDAKGKITIGQVCGRVGEAKSGIEGAEKT